MFLAHLRSMIDHDLGLLCSPLGLAVYPDQLGVKGLGLGPQPWRYPDPGRYLKALQEVKQHLGLSVLRSVLCGDASHLNLTSG